MKSASLLLLIAITLSGCITRSKVVSEAAGLDAPLRQITFVQPEFPTPFLELPGANEQPTKLVDYEITDNRIKFTPIPHPRQTKESPDPVASVTVQFFITETGNVRDIKVINPIDSNYETSAIHAISQWRYLPPIRNGKPVAIQVTQPVLFKTTYTTAVVEKEK